MNTGGGFLVISLDFEVFWGMFDKVSIDSYGENMRGVQHVVPELLALFTEHDIHATWGTVGLLLCSGKDDLRLRIPRESLQPRYPNMAVSAYEHFRTTQIGTNEKDDPYHFAPSLVREIVTTPGQELASHTFSHYYCIDGAENKSSIFAEDLTLLKNIFSEFGVVPTSIIFPRNQVTDTALAACKDSGITAYRGTEKSFIYTPRKDGAQSRFVRGLRLLDAYWNLTGHHTTQPAAVREAILNNIPSSRFFRPYSRRLRLFERLRLRRIKKSMTYAAEHNEIFHLWWHPHNFGKNKSENMKNLQELIEHFTYLKATYGMQSRNMQEISETATATYVSFER